MARRCRAIVSPSRSPSAEPSSSAPAACAAFARRGWCPASSTGRGTRARSSCDERSLRTALTGPSGLHAIVDVVIEGQTTPHHAVLKDFQRHPIRGTLTHVDFHEVRLDRPIQATVSLELVGESPGSKQGGIVQLVSREVQVEALPTGIPEHVELDISALEVGVTLRVEDLAPIEGVTFLDDPQLVLATCTMPARSHGARGRGCRGRRRGRGGGGRRGRRRRRGLGRGRSRRRGLIGAPLPQGRGRDCDGLSGRRARQSRARARP